MKGLTFDFAKNTTAFNSDSLLHLFWIRKLSQKGSLLKVGFLDSSAFKTFNVQFLGLLGVKTSLKTWTLVIKGCSHFCIIFWSKDPILDSWKNRDPDLPRTWNFRFHSDFSASTQSPKEKKIREEGVDLKFFLDDLIWNFHSAVHEIMLVLFGRNDFISNS